jgi:nicotinamide-nucleotide amidase
LRALSGIEHPPSALELKFTGIGESDFHQGVDARLEGVPGLEFGYCAHIGEVDLRLIGSPAVLERGRAIALETFAEFLVSEDGSSMEETVVRLLREKNKRLATAESCTGGLIANRITDVPGASEVFVSGFVTYANEAKVSQLGVSPETLTAYGAVSGEVAKEMAEGALRAGSADIAVSVTGIAGPGGGSEEKPVGTAWIGLATSDGHVGAQRVYQPRNRHDFKLAVSQAALNAVRKVLTAP